VEVEDKRLKLTYP